jgi:predicted metal-binding protein
MSNIGPTGQAAVLVCITCRVPTDSLDAPRAGAALAEATVQAAANSPEISVRRVRCLGNCNRGLSAAIRCENTWTYVFGGLDPANDGAALIAGAQLLAQTADGLMPWRERPEALKRGLISRVPPLHYRDDLP